MYLPLFGGGYSGFTPESIGRTPLDKLFWHLRRLNERRDAEIAAFNNSSAPRPPAADE